MAKQLFKFYRAPGGEKLHKIITCTGADPDFVLKMGTVTLDQEGIDKYHREGKLCRRCVL